MNPEQSGVKSWQWVITVIVIIVLIVVGIMVFGNGSGEPTDTAMTDTSGGSATESNRIVMSDQFPGNVVYISSVQLANGGWVTIHKDDAGKPGAIIGSAYFEKGINPGKITLTSATVDGSIYYAMLRSDDGDKVFNESKDAPLKDSKGNIIMKLFRASSSAGVEIKG